MLTGLGKKGDEEVGGERSPAILTLYFSAWRFYQISEVGASPILACPGERPKSLRSHHLTVPCVGRSLLTMLAEVGRHLLKGLRHPALVRTTMALAVLPTRSPGVGRTTTKAQARGAA